ncbi:hypothetical protein A1O3_04033 [Capronia epimyces CBS 606.96]|uniref:Uncharacterized protein n=1 Tax=Capronia epimyces CBS 606.96 TaxID=1182542 RepID=W9YBN8_9EURO|nr:uncharacterized protein A1O3_04033 [Capronia epimyces CBS 606.96]EXJ87075.1 hypothetical protein A1O3_04033 [Capronia epimyces CBS 606.96]
MTTTSSSSSVSDISLASMHNYGDSWFENLGSLALEFHQQKQAKSRPESPETAPQAQTQAQAEAAEANSEPLPSPTAEVTPALHGYGNAWFDKFDSMWEDWQHSKTAKAARI